MSGRIGSDCLVFHGAVHSLHLAVTRSGRIHPKGATEKGDPSLADAQQDLLQRLRKFCNRFEYFVIRNERWRYWDCVGYENGRFYQCAVDAFCTDERL